MGSQRVGHDWATEEQNSKQKRSFWVEEEEAAWSATLCVAVTSVGAVEEMGSLKVTGMEAKYVMIAI